MTAPIGKLRTEGTHRGGGMREVFDLAYPIVLTQLATTTMGVVDAAMVGRLGATELAATGFGGIWLWTLFTLFYGTASGVQTFVSQADGAGNRDRCGAWAWHALTAVVPATALGVVCVGIAFRPALAWLAPSPEMQTLAVAYALPRLPGEIAMAAVMVLTSFFRGIGDTRTPLYIALFANVVNAVLDYGLIFGAFGLPAWGVVGAGTATSIGHGLSALALYVAFRRRAVGERYRTAPVRPDFRAIERFLRTGAPIGGQWFLDMSAFALFTTLVARMGDIPMAASQAFLQLLSLSFMQAVGVSVAASTLVGRYVGAGDPDAAVRSWHMSLGLCVLLAAGVAALFLSVPELLLQIFTDDRTVVSLGVPLLLLGAVFQVFDAAAIVTSGALRGAGDTRWPFVVQALLGWGLLLPASWVGGIVLEGGLTGAWFGALLHIVTLAAVLVYRFRSGAWQRIRI